jgi:hydrogenase maturation protease
MRTHLVCLGNELVGDDGIGIRVGRVLLGLALPSEITVELRASLGFDLLDIIEQQVVPERLRLGPLGQCHAAEPPDPALIVPGPTSTQIVLVDAMSTGRAPGTCRVWSGADLLSRALPPQDRTCCHLVGIDSALDIAKTLWPDVVEHSLAVVGIEGECFCEFTTALSPAVRNALPSAVERVLRMAGAEDGLLSRAMVECEIWTNRDPTAAELCH